MKLRRLLEGVRRLQQVGLAEHRPHELQADGQAPGRKAAGHRNAGNPAQVGGNGEDVRQVHGQRVIHLFPQTEGRGGSHGGGDHPALPERGLEVPADQGPHLGSFFIIGLIIAGG